MTPYQQIAVLHGRRDDLIRQLWQVFRKLSDYDGTIRMTDEDLELWTHVTKHDACQNRLGKRMVHEETKNGD